MDISSLSSRDCGLAGARATGDSQAHTLGQDRPSQTHPYGVLRRVRHWGGGRLARPISNRSQPGLASPLDTVHHHIFSLVENLKVTIKKSNFELATLVLHESTLLTAVPEACMAVPRSGSDNNPTVSWSIHEASTINPVVTDILRICALHSRMFS